MKKLNLLFVAFALVSFIALGACKSKTSQIEDVASQLEQAMDEASQEMEQALDEMEETVDSAAVEVVEEAPAQ